jgi:hypothetical protein
MGDETGRFLLFVSGGRRSIQLSYARMATARVTPEGCWLNANQVTSLDGI